VAYRIVKFGIGLVEQDIVSSSDRLLVPTAAQVYLDDHTTVATIFADGAGTPLTNTPSVPHGVTPDTTGGIDTVGNLVFWADPTKGYSALFNGTFLPVPTLPMHPADFTDHVDGTNPDPHGDREYADDHKVDQTSLGVAEGVATLDGSGFVTSTQMVCR
jgi:hypothetical protein